MISPLAAYLFAAMLSWSPLSAHPEPEAVTTARYQDLAESVAELAEDPSTAPVFAGDDGRPRTAVLLLAIASFESGGFASAVQFCSRLGDGGRARGLFQLHGGGVAACSTARVQATAALSRVKESIDRCSLTGQEPATWLAAYASGSCSRGWLAARNRWERAASWMRAHPWRRP